jgi:hypothetical protein
MVCDVHLYYHFCYGVSPVIEELAGSKLHLSELQRWSVDEMCPWKVSSSWSKLTPEDHVLPT